jgi:hypothetical protein
MRVRLRLSNQDLVDDLLDFLSRRECVGERIEGTRLLEVALPHALHERQAQMELDLLLRVWQVLHPGVRIEVVPHTDP